MPDVFISYAREDRDQAERLARALSEEGLEVWWDVESLRSGSESFSQSIDNALKDAQRVLVLWSAHSVESKWVDAEALRAWDAGKLHSIWLAQDVPVRVPFNASHARNLSDWDGSTDFPEFRRLLDDIRTLKHAPEGTGGGAAGSIQGGGKACRRRGPRPMLAILGLVAPTAIALALTLALMHWHRPTTHLKLDLELDRVAFTVARSPSSSPQTPIELMNHGQVRVAQAERVGRVLIDRRAMETADPTRYDRASGRFPEDAWRPLAIPGETALEPSPGTAGVQTSVVLQAEDDKTPGTLKVVRAGAGTAVAIEAGMEPSGQRPWLTLDLRSIGAGLDLVFPRSFLLFADGMKLGGAAGLGYPEDGLSLRAPIATDTLVSIRGSERGLVLQVEPAGPAEALLDGIQVPVSDLDFTRQGPTGERRSTLIGPGSLAYPDLPAKGKVELAAGEFVSVGGIEQARIESLGVNSEAGRVGLGLILAATASQVRVGFEGQPRDARLSWFDWLRHHPWRPILFAIAVWFFTTTLAGYKLWQGLRSSRASS